MSIQKAPSVYFENHDALRFISFLMIFLGHALDADSELVRNHPFYLEYRYYIGIVSLTGFNLAFVLSSYINTWVILTEIRNSKEFKPMKYLVRRALRIWPLYYTTLIIGFLILPWVKDMMGAPYDEPANYWYFIFFIGNFYLIAHGIAHSPVISYLWSISVEEQFYVFWPFLLGFFRKYIKWLFAATMLVFVVSTFYLYDKVNLYFHSLFLLADIVMGAIFAWISFERGRLFEWLEKRTKIEIIISYCLFLACVIFNKQLFENTFLPPIALALIEKTIIAVLLGFFLFEQNFSPHSFIKFGNIKYLTFLGVISYGLFCFHSIGLLFVNYFIKLFGMADNLFGILVIKPTLTFLIIIPVAYVSYFYFEIKFLRLKNKFYS